MPEGSGTSLKNLVLAADDESMVLRVVTTTLSMAGFRTEIVTNGAAGLEKYRELRDEICLALIDVVMPECGGLEMAAGILELDPAAKILFMSGYSDAAQE